MAKQIFLGIFVALQLVLSHQQDANSTGNPGSILSFNLSIPITIPAIPTLPTTTTSLTTPPTSTNPSSTTAVSSTTPLRTAAIETTQAMNHSTTKTAFATVVTNSSTTITTTNPPTIAATTTSMNSTTTTITTPLVTSTAATSSSDFIVLFDNARGELVKFSPTNPENVTVLQSRQSGEVGDLMNVNPLNGDIYWFDHANSYIFKLSNGTDHPVLVLQIDHVKSLAVDPLTENVYFVNGDTETIDVIDANGTYLKNLTAPPSATTDVVFNDHLVLDVINKHVYWKTSTDNYNFGGDLERIGFDGSNRTIVLREISDFFQINSQKQLLYLLEEVHESKALLYEIPLSSMATFDREKPENGTVHHINFPPETYYYITDFVVVDSLLFFTSDPGGMLHQVNLNQDLDTPDEVNVIEVDKAPVNPSRIRFSPSHLAAFNSAEQTLIAALNNSCENNKCSDLCLLTPANSSVCACRNGFTLHGTEDTCRNSSEKIDFIPPTYGNTCPEDYDISYYECQPPSINLTAPVWTDDVTNKSMLNLTFPSNNRTTYPRGQYTFTYTATDSSGNTGYCSFVVHVLRPLSTCSLSDFFINSSSVVTYHRGPTCKHGANVIAIQCKDTKKLVRYGNRLEQVFDNTCQQMNESIWQYEVPNALLFSCEIPVPTFPPTASSTNASISDSSTTHIYNGTTEDVRSGRNKDNRGGLNKGAVIAIVVVVLILGAAIVIFFGFRRRRLNRRSVTEDRTGILTWENGESSDNAYHRL